MHSHMAGTYKSGDTWTQYKCPKCGKFKTVRDDIQKIVVKNVTGIITEDDLIAENDYNYIIKKALDELKPGEYRDRESLLQACRLKKNNDVYNVLKSEQFRKYQGVTRKDQKLIFGHPSRIKKLIEDTVLIEIP